MSNAAEVIAGTDPKSNKSYLRIDATAFPVGAELQFNAVSNRTYTIQYRDQVTTAPWLKLADIPGRSNTSVVRVTDVGYTTNRFYRVITPRQP